MKNIFILFVIAFMILTFSGCYEEVIKSSQEATVCQFSENGKNLKVLLISSNKYYWCDKQQEIIPIFDSAVNSGIYNIVEIKTYYSSSYLTAAEILYTTDSIDCRNNKSLKMILLTSNEYYWSEKDAEIRPKFDKIINSGTYNIKTTNTVILDGYLVAAEIYYYE
jgi:hypothetical protein